MYPRRAPCRLFVDELVEAPDLADGGKEKAKLLNVVRANIRRLPLHVLAFVTAPDAVVELRGAKARGDDDCLPEGFTHLVKVIHQSVEVFDLRLVGVVGDAFLEGGGASCELREGKVLAHSYCWLVDGYLLFISLRTFDERFTKTVYILVSYDAPRAFVEASHALLYVLLRVPWAILPDTRELGDQYR